MSEINLVTSHYDGIYLRNRKGNSDCKHDQDSTTKGGRVAITWGKDVAVTEGASLINTDKDSTDQHLLAMKQAIDCNDIALLDRIVKAHPEIVNQINYNFDFDCDDDYDYVVADYDDDYAAAADDDDDCEDDYDFDEGATMLVYATYEDNLEAVKVLLANKADADVVFTENELKKTLVYQVASLDDTGILEEILKKSKKHVNTKCGNFSPLLKAVGSGNIKAAKLLIDNGADINIYSGNSERQLKYAEGTPLMYAAFRLDVAMVKILLEAGADVTKGSLYYTSDNSIGKKAVVDAMREFNFSKVDVVDAKTKKFEILALLSKYGANIDLEYLQDIQKE
jgi:ankyrin repeat protein